MNLETTFQRLGLGKHSPAIYSCLLNSKHPLAVTHLANKQKISRMSVYRCLDELLQNKFIKTTTIGKRTHYSAKSPRLIHSAFKTDSNQVAATAEHLALQRNKELPDNIRHFTGFTGIQAIFSEVIAHTPKGETFYRYTSEKSLEETNRYLPYGYRQHRDKKKLERLVISNPISATQKKPRLERFIKYIPSDSNLFNQNIIQLLYGNRLAFMNLNTEEAFVIEDKALASFQKAIFNQLYKKL